MLDDMVLNGFGKSNDTYNNDVPEKPKTAEEKRDIFIKELIDKAKESGFDLEVVNSGSIFNYDKNINWVKKEVTEGVDKSKLLLVKDSLNILHSYLSSIILKDNSGKSVNSFKNWGNENLKKGTEAEKIFSSNRIRSDVNQNIIDYIKFLGDSIVNQSIKNELLKLIEEIPEEFEKFDEEKGGLKYYFLSYDERIKVVQDFSNVVQKVISVLEDSVELK
jgi:organic radical activating enzyme